MNRTNTIRQARADFRNGLMRELTNTAGQLMRLQRENETVRRRMDDVLLCNARFATMLHQQSRMLCQMSQRLDDMAEDHRSWFACWLDGVAPLATQRQTAHIGNSGHKP